MDEGHVLEVRGDISGAPLLGSEDAASLPQPVDVTIVAKGGQVEKLRELAAKQNKRKAKDKKLEEEKQKRSKYVQPSLLNGLGKEQVCPSFPHFCVHEMNQQEDGLMFLSILAFTFSLIVITLSS